MKAQGNRLTPHEVVSIELVSEEEPDEPPKGRGPEDRGDAERDNTASVADKGASGEGSNRSNAGQSGAESCGTKDSQMLRATSGDASVASGTSEASRKLELEITNPEDVEIDDKGQIGLF